jgi:hypothetical protein
MVEMSVEQPKIIQKAKLESPLKGNGTFIPKKLATKVGIISTSVMTVRRFITSFRLFDIIDANASIVLAKMFE